MDDNVPSEKGSPPILRYTVSVIFDKVKGMSYKIDRDQGFPLMVAAHVLDKCRLRLLMEELTIEQAQVAQQQAGKIVEAKAMPLEKVAGRIQAGRH